MFKHLLGPFAGNLEHLPIVGALSKLESFMQPTGKFPVENFRLNEFPIKQADGLPMFGRSQPELGQKGKNGVEHRVIRAVDRLTEKTAVKRQSGNFQTVGSLLDPIGDQRPKFFAHAAIPSRRIVRTRTLTEQGPLSNSFSSYVTVEIRRSCSNPTRQAVRMTWRSFSSSKSCKTTQTSRSELSRAVPFARDPKAQSFASGYCPRN